MNEFTFFYELHWYVFCEDDTHWPQNNMAPEMYFVRMRTKYTRSTAARKAKKLVADYVEKKVQNGEFVIKNTYWKTRYYDGGINNTQFITPKQGNLVYGFPHLVRIDQPEGAK